MSNENPLAKLSKLRGSLGDSVLVETKADAEALTQSREDYRVFIADRTEAGWQQADIDEFAALVKEAMQTPEGKQAAADFLADQSHIIRETNRRLRESVNGINALVSQSTAHCQAIFLPAQ